MHRLALPFTVAALASFASITASAATSYPLTCRGGSGTLGYNTEYGYSALFYFKKASGPAGAGLRPGECAWADRAVGPNEPTCLRQQGVHTSAWIFPDNRQNSYFNSTQAPWLRSLLDANKFQTFQAYNPGDGNCFTVTRLGP